MLKAVIIVTILRIIIRNCTSCALFFILATQ
nr:MAG TPA: hypothetical protein [Caudoviricetes sp.]